MKKSVIGVVLIVCFLAIAVAGLFLGGYRDSLGRASAICWECIGLGE